MTKQERAKADDGEAGALLITGFIFGAIATLIVFGVAALIW